MDFQIESGTLHLYGNIVHEDLVELMPVFFDYMKSQEEHIIFDLKSVDAMDTLVLQTLIAVKRSAKRENKTFKLLNINEQLKESLSVSGLDMVFEWTIDKK